MTRATFLLSPVLMISSFPTKYHSEVVFESGKGCAFKKLGIQDEFAPIGLQEDIMSMLGIDSNGIIAAVREVMKADFEEDNDWDDEF